MEEINNRPTTGKHQSAKKEKEYNEAKEVVSLSQKKRIGMPR